jgi:hypothetical protein
MDCEGNGLSVVCPDRLRPRGTCFSDLGADIRDGPLRHAYGALNRHRRGGGVVERRRRERTPAERTQNRPPRRQNLLESPAWVGRIATVPGWSRMPAGWS